MQLIFIAGICAKLCSFVSVLAFVALHLQKRLETLSYLPSLDARHYTTPAGRT